MKTLTTDKDQAVIAQLDAKETRIEHFAEAVSYVRRDKNTIVPGQNTTIFAEGRITISELRYNSTRMTKQHKSKGGRREGAGRPFNNYETIPVNISVRLGYEERFKIAAAELLQQWYDEDENDPYAHKVRYRRKAGRKAREIYFKTREECEQFIEANADDLTWAEIYP